MPIRIPVFLQIQSLHFNHDRLFPITINDYINDVKRTLICTEHVIGKTKKKVDWGKKTKDTPRISKKGKSPREKYKTPRRQRRNMDDDDDDDGDVEVEKVPRNGHGVARLSYLTQKNGEEMEHAISDGIMDVEDVGRNIEEKGV